MKTIEKTVSELVGYINDVTKMNGFLMDKKSLFGDGSRWKEIGYSGFEIVYNQYAQAYDNSK